MMNLNSIVIQEDVHLNGNYITIKEQPESNDFIRKKGCDFSTGFTIKASTLIRPSTISLIAAMNFKEVMVHCKPSVAIIPTGSELIEPGNKIPDDKIIGSNSYGLAAMLKSFGAEPKIFPINPDIESEIEASINAARDFDIILTVGGASVGKYDLIRKCVSSFGIKLAFNSVLMRPGKPLLAGTLKEKIFIGLPGNPISSLLCCHIIIKPIIEKMVGCRLDKKKLKIHAKLSTSLKKNGKREHFQRALLKNTKNGFEVYPLPKQDSSLISELNKSNALIKRPPNAPGIPSGQIIEVLSFFSEFN